MSLDFYLEYGPCEHCGAPEREAFSANITHNLNKMAGECGLYMVLWRPEEIGISTAGDAAPLIEAGIASMKSERERVEQFEPANGWGDYSGLLGFAESCLAACREHPKAKVRACR